MDLSWRHFNNLSSSQPSQRADIQETSSTLWLNRTLSCGSVSSAWSFWIRSSNVRSVSDKSRINNVICPMEARSFFASFSGPLLSIVSFTKARTAEKVCRWSCLRSGMIDLISRRRRRSDPMHARIASSPNSSWQLEYWSFSVTPSEMHRRKTLKSTKCKIAARSGLTSSSKFQAGQRLKYL